MLPGGSGTLPPWLITTPAALASGKGMADPLLGAEDWLEGSWASVTPIEGYSLSYFYFSSS